MNGKTGKRKRKSNVRIREAKKWEERTRRECNEGQGTDRRNKRRTER
jgi:hypothetical protein